jgi:osmotically inducible protein OsmC
MPRIERKAEVVWEGNVARGAGSISAHSGAFTNLPYSLAARIGKSEGKTSPEELLAAAHGGCITMSIAGELVAAGITPGRIDVTCLIVMDEVEGQGHQIVGSHVEAVVAAEGLDDAGLQAALVKADEGCPFSSLLKRAGAEVHVAARLG